MVKTTVYLDEKYARCLRAMSKRQSKPQAQLIREAIHKLTEEETPPLPSGMGMFSSGKSDTSMRRKEILKERAAKWRS